MARTIAVALRKGGSGKTTTALNLAAGLHLLGKRALLVDLDPQANATLAAGVDPATLPRHLGHLLMNNGMAPAGVVTETAFGLALLPAHPDLAQAERGLTAAQGGLLRELLAPLAAAYDHIVLDTAPAESALTVNALAAADEVVIPLHAHYLALQGLAQALEQIEQVRDELNPRLAVAGILPTLVNTRTSLGRAVLEEVRRHYPALLYSFAVEYSIRHSEASLVGRPIVLHDPRHQGARAYMELARRFA
jgi:chromosome partitioning protein